MKNFRKLAATLLFLSLSAVVLAQLPFKRGVNLTGWFQVQDAQSIDMGKYTKQDFMNIKGMGCDVVRLPINLHFMTSGEPNYTLDPLFLKNLDLVMDWAEELKLYLLIDNHTFDPRANTEASVETPLTKVWQQMAERYKNRSNYIYFEILNEPHGIDDKIWSDIQGRVIDEIRKMDTKHTLIVGPANWNSYQNLSKMTVYKDNNLLYTFHFYDPFMFTHQGASWNTPSMEPLKNVPFPYNENWKPTIDETFKGTWVENGLNNYKNDGTVQKVKELIDIAVKFKDTNKVNIFCGEFGVYDKYSNNTHRVLWYKVVCNYLEKNKIAWTIWDYHGGFGLFNKDSKGEFPADVNKPLAKAIKLKVK